MILAVSGLDNVGGSFGSLADGIMDFLTGMGITAIGGQFVFLALLGIIAVVLFFAVGALVSLKSKTKADTMIFRSTTAFINEAGEIGAEQAEELNYYLRGLPEPVSRGWGNFLEQKVSYPSDYISEEEVFTSKRYASNFRLGKTLYAVLAAVAALVIIFLASVVSARHNTLGSFDKGIAVTLAFQILSVIIAPLILYVVLYAVLAAVYRAQEKQCVAAYREFAAALDGAVTIFRETKSDEEFLKENVEVINEEIEKIIASKIQQNEIIDLVTTPRIGEEEAASAVQEEIPEIGEETVQPADDEETAEEQQPEENVSDGSEPMTKEEEESQLRVLVSIVDNAIADVRGTTKEDLEELALIIFNAKQSGFEDPKDQEVLDECLHKLSDLYYR